jgi:23S rRNA (uracil1939-C5)-methyltransferase
LLPSPEVLNGTVEKLVSGGDGLVRGKGPLVFVPGALPGETIRYVVSAPGKGFSRGRLLEVVSPSPDRRSPPCHHYGLCGGCDFMHLNEAAQRSQKQALVVESFRRIAKIAIDLPAIEAGPDWAYRSRVQIHKDERGRVGFMGRNSRDLVEVGSCPVVVPGIQRLLDEGAPELPVGRTTVFCPADVPWSQGRDPVVRIDVVGKPFLVATDGFFQSNLALLPPFLAQVLHGLPKGHRALDLYAGVGLFGAFLADRFERVTVVEENPAALALARKNVVGPLNEFVASSVEAWVPQLRKLRPAPSWDAIVVDPPRTGLSPEIRSFLAEFPSPHLVYVSCNPDTLARDTADLRTRGYRLESLKLFDFYPQTSHIEAVTRFVR